MRPSDLDLSYVRAHFPAFSEPGIRQWAHFDNAGGTYACRYVIWRLSRFVKERRLQPFGPAEPSRLGGEEITDARIAIAQLLGVQAEEISFGPSTTQNAYVLARAFEQWLPAGSTVIVTDQDHEANSGPWRKLARSGIRIREWRMREDGHLDPADLSGLLDSSVRLVCFPHCSNIVGELNDAAAIVRMVHAAGALACVDGASQAAHGLPQIGAIGADIYLFSGYMAYGPHQGIMYVRRGLAHELPNQGHDFGAGDLTQKFTPGGADHAQIAACGGISDYVDALYSHHFTAGRDAKGRSAEVAKLMRAQVGRLTEPVLDWLDTRKDVVLIGPRRGVTRTATLSLDTPGLPSEARAELARRGLIVGAGDFCAPRTLTALGIAPKRGVLRLSLVHYILPEEVDRLVEALDHVL